MPNPITDSWLINHLSWLLDQTDYPPGERERLVRLMALFAALPPPPDPLGLFPHYAPLKERFHHAALGADGEVLEEAFLNLYCHLHGHQAPYTRQERLRLDEAGGYWCHAGGLSPILKAGGFIFENTVSGDFGAGNGLQGLLLQKLYPHCKTIQIEISSRMVKAGRQLQAWLDIPTQRIEWIVGDVLDANADDMDFIYLYRPVRPEGKGRRFYERLAAKLSTSTRPITLFSIADCLRPFLPADFEIFYTDGHLTCYRNSPAF